MQDDDDPTHHEPEDLEGVIDRVLSETEGQDDVGVDDLLDAFSERLLGPFVLLPVLLATLPTGAVPGLPTIVGLLIVLLASQWLIGSGRPWVPRKLREQKVSREKLESAFETARPWARRVDKLLKPRLSVLTEGVLRRVNALLIVLLALMMTPLEIVPFATMVPALAVMLLGLSFTARDGALVIAGWVLAAVGGYLLWWVVF